MREAPFPAPWTWGSNHSRPWAGEEVPWEPWPSITEATSTKSQTIRRRAGALLTHRAAIGRMLDDRRAAILMIYSNTHYSQSIFTQR